MPTYNGIYVILINILFMYLHVCIYIYIYVCMYIYIYVCICIHAHCVISLLEWSHCGIHVPYLLTLTLCWAHNLFHIYSRHAICALSICRYSDILSDIYSVILSGTLFGIQSRIDFEVVFDILSDILLDILFGIQPFPSFLAFKLSSMGWRKGTSCSHLETLT